MSGDLPPIIYIPMEIFLFYSLRKKGENKRRQLIAKGEDPVLVCSPEFWEHPRAHALECPSLRRMHLYGNLLYKLNLV
jgi:hypothetical protein